MRRFPWKAILILVVLWGVAGGVMWAARQAKATPEGVQRYLAEHPVAGKPPEARGQVVEKLAKQLNQLTVEQRRQGPVRKEVDSFFRGLEPVEKERFLDLTMPTGMKQMMEAFNQMTSENRRKFVDRALREMHKEGEEGLPQGDEAVYRQKMVQHGVHSFYADATADTKLDFAPLLEQMQRNLQGLP